jgi:hypothetical protein
VKNKTLRPDIGIPANLPHATWGWLRDGPRAWVDPRVVHWRFHAPEMALSLSQQFVTSFPFHGVVPRRVDMCSIYPEIFTYIINLIAQKKKKKKKKKF